MARAASLLAAQTTLRYSIKKLFYTKPESVLTGVLLFMEQVVNQYLFVYNIRLHKKHISV